MSDIVLFFFFARHMERSKKNIPVKQFKFQEYFCDAQKHLQIFSMAGQYKENE
ncbi:hypothetical protein [Novacetimonas cocois]|uniref:hypothetical protein n=1 Tax=Novacetimonas cocois TaxID=1747507 RepID=UPI00140373C9|nr:hypothetical protein [Novacetimonas cocois]